MSSVVLVVRSILFNILFYVALIVLMIGGLPTMLAGPAAIEGLARLWGRVSVWLLEKVAGLHVEYRGLENIPRDQGYILASKHQSFLETFALLKNAPDFAIILKRQLTYLPLFGQYLTLSNQIAIDRGRGVQALQQLVTAAKPVLAAGRQIMVYPEGTRRTPGAPPRYKHGVTALYAESQAPCVPVALNTGLFWRRREFLRRPGTAVIEYLPAIPPGLSRAEFAKTLQDAIETACARLNEEAIARDPSLREIVENGAREVDERQEAKR